MYQHITHVLEGGREEERGGEGEEVECCILHKYLRECLPVFELSDAVQFVLRNYSLENYVHYSTMYYITVHLGQASKATLGPN